MSVYTGNVYRHFRHIARHSPSGWTVRRSIPNLFVLQMAQRASCNRPSTSSRDGLAISAPGSRDESCSDIRTSVEYNEAVHQEAMQEADEMNFLTLTCALLYYR